MKLIIDRSKWYRGITTGSALVRVDDGKMCCLGFLGTMCGGDPNKKTQDGLHVDLVREQGPHVGILGQTMPNKGQTFWPQWLFSKALSPDHTKTISQRLANVNDSPYIGDDIKELEISSIMKKYGDIDVEFIDGESPPISPT